MKEKKNIILLIIAIILFLVALIFLVWSTKQKNIDNTNINNNFFITYLPIKNLCHYNGEGILSREIFKKVKFFLSCIIFDSVPKSL